MKKFLLTLLTILCLSCCFLFVGCGDNGGNTDNDDQIKQVYYTYVAYAESNGETPMSYEDWLASIKGEKGDKGDTGANGQDGKDGVTPTIEISEDGFWVINGEKTEVKAVGVDGANGTNGINGQDGVDGKDGQDGVDGVTPTIEISEDGFWVINGEKTTTKAIGIDGTNGKDGTNGTNGLDGKDGKDGVTPTIEIIDGYWYINGENSGVKAEGKDGVNGTNGANGTDGEGGMSAYQIFKRYYPNYQGSEKDWITDVALNNICNLFGHEYKKDVISPTCKSEGYTYCVCNVCKDVLVENYTETVAHDYFGGTCKWCGYCEALNFAEYITTEDGWVVALTETDAFLMTYVGDGIEMFIPSIYETKKLKFDYFSFDFDSLQYSLEKLFIPDSFNMLIDDYQFHNFDALTYVYIGNAVESIGSESFGLCDNLKTLILGEGITSIGSGAFDQCYNLNLIKYNPIRVTSTGNLAPFELCGTRGEGITLEIGANVETLPYHLLSSWNDWVESAPNIKKIKIASNSVLVEIENQCFYNCQFIEEIFLPKSLEVIGTAAFYGTGINKVFFAGTSDDWLEVRILGENTPIINATKYFYIANEADVPNDGGNYWHYVDGVPTAWVKD